MHQPPSLGAPLQGTWPAAARPPFRSTDGGGLCCGRWRQLAAIREMRDVYGYRRVLLATNGGPALLEELRSALDDMEVTSQPIPDRDKYACCPEGVLDCSGVYTSSLSLI